MKGKTGAQLSLKHKGQGVSVIFTEYGHPETCGSHATEAWARFAFSLGWFDVKRCRAYYRKQGYRCLNVKL